MSVWCVVHRPSSCLEIAIVKAIHQTYGTIHISSTYKLEHDFPGRKADMYDSSRICCLDMCRFTKQLYVYLHLNFYMPSSMV